MKKIKKRARRKNTRQKKDLSNSILFLLLLFWLFIQGISFSSMMLTGSSTANVTSATGTVSFRVIRPAAVPEPVVPVVIEPAAITVSIPSFAHFMTPSPVEKVGEIVQPTPIVEMPAPALFDIVLEPIAPEITVGQDMTLKLSLTNFGALEGAVPVTVTYAILDEMGNVVYTAEQQVTVETQTELLETLPLPPDLPAGTYVVTVGLSYNGQTAQSSTTVAIASASESQKASPLQAVRDFGAAAVNKVVSFFHTVTEGIARWFFELFG